MKTRKTPYWWAVIERAKERKKAGKPAFTDAQQRQSVSWQTCACGKQDPRIPRLGATFHYAPADELLAALGGGFCHAVVRGAPADAAVFLRKIERRAAEILAGLA